MVLSIIKEARARNIPVTFALSRKKLGDCLWVKSRVSAVAVIDVSGAHDVWSKILNLTLNEKVHSENHASMSLCKCIAI